VTAYHSKRKLMPKFCLWNQVVMSFLEKGGGRTNNQTGYYRSFVSIYICAFGLSLQIKFGYCCGVVKWQNDKVQWFV
jgi:hypothetical protein